MRLKRRSCGAAAVFHQTRYSIALNPTETRPKFHHSLPPFPEHIVGPIQRGIPTPSNRIAKRADWIGLGQRRNTGRPGVGSGQAQLGHRPAIHRIILTRGKAAFFSCQKRHPCCNLFWLSAADDRVDFANIAAECTWIGHGLDEFLVQIRVDPARRNRVTASSFMTMIHGDCVDQALQSCLGDTIGRMARLAAQLSIEPVLTMLPRVCRKCRNVPRARSHLQILSFSYIVLFQKLSERR